MLIGQLIIGSVLGLAGSIYAYLVLDLSLWMALATYSGVGLGAVLITAILIVPLKHPEQSENCQTEPLRKLDAAR